MLSKTLLFKSLFKKDLIEFKRYFFNSIGGLITIYIIFLLLFTGYKGLNGDSPNFGRNVEGLVVGYTMWLFALTSYQEISINIRTECIRGTLEQLYMSAYPFRLILILRTIGSILFQLLMVGIMMLLLMITTGKYLNIDLLSIIPILLLTVLCFYGIGLIIGGLTIIFKRIESYTQIMQFAIIGFITAPVSVQGLKFLPGTLGTNMIKDIMINGKNLFSFPPTKILLLAAIGFFYLLIGSIIYKLCETKAMEKGVLGHY